MGRKPASEVERESGTARARLVPTQQRSRERYERILAGAATVMAEKGSEAFRMSDVVERTGVPFGSLYQYFPDKSAIVATLAERNNAIGRECVALALATIESIDDLHPALCRITDSYYQMFLDEPVMRDIWQATQADRALQAIDAEDGAFLAGLLADALRPLTAGQDEQRLAIFTQLVMVLIASAVRHAIVLPLGEARALLDQFKALLPRAIG